MAMTMDVCPDGGIAIDILSAVEVPEHCAMALDEDERFVLRCAP
jgi:hypothetical protein